MTTESLSSISLNPVGTIAAGSFVKQNATGVIVAADPNDLVIGVALTAAVAADAALAVAKMDGGRVPMLAGAAITQGAAVTSDASGRAVTATTGDSIFGHAAQAAGAADVFVDVILLYSGLLPA